MKRLPHTRSCFVCGEANPRGFNLRSETDGRIVQARLVFDATHVGFKETVHGGLTATVLDEVMTWACVVQSRRFAYCAELNVRYLKPVRPGLQLVATAEMTSNRRGRVFETKGEILDSLGTTLAAATGKYIPLKELDAAEMKVDFIGDLAWLFGPESQTEHPGQ
jgi:uncharacterized protein (TIGR00369 family)